MIKLFHARSLPLHFLATIRVWQRKEEECQMRLERSANNGIPIPLSDVLQKLNNCIKKQSMQMIMKPF